MKDVEKYFLSLAGQGLMLSSMDYSLINKWKERGVPKEIVLRGINTAFNESSRKQKSVTEAPKSIRQCAEYVEKCIEDYGHKNLANSKGNASDVRSEGIIGEVVEKLSRIIDGESSEELRNYYLNLRIKILMLRDSGAENLLKGINGVEEECMEELFGGLPEDEKQEIASEAESFLKERARYMTEDAYRESLISFRNEILAKRYGIKTVS